MVLEILGGGATTTGKAAVYEIRRNPLIILNGRFKEGKERKRRTGS